MTNIKKFILLIALICFTSYGQTCERTGHIVTFDTNVTLETRDPSVMVRFYWSAGPSLHIKIKPPKVIDYKYNGKTYNAKEYGFDNYRPSGANQSIISNCLTKSQILTKNSWKFDAGKAFSFTGDIISVKNVKEEWNDNEKRKKLLKDFNFEKADVCDCSINLLDADYSGIKTIIDNVLAKRERWKMDRELSDKQDKELADFFDAKKEFEQKEPTKQKEVFFDLPETKEEKDNSFWEKEKEPADNKQQNEIRIDSRQRDLKITTGYMTDSRDGQQYKTVTYLDSKTKQKITWMAENINYSIEGSSSLNNNSSNREEGKGLLYNIHAALVACPTGWHLATYEDWTFFANYGFYNKDFLLNKEWEHKLGTNILGMNILPTGYRFNYLNAYERFFEYGAYFWTSSYFVDYSNSGKSAYITRVIDEIQPIGYRSEDVMITVFSENKGNADAKSVFDHILGRETPDDFLAYACRCVKN